MQGQFGGNELGPTDGGGNINGGDKIRTGQGNNHSLQDHRNREITQDSNVHPYCSSQKFAYPGGGKRESICEATNKETPQIVWATCTWRL